MVKQRTNIVKPYGKLQRLDGWGARAAGNVLAGLSHATKDVMSGAGDMVGSVLKGPIQAILNIILVAALAVEGIALLYIGVRWWWIRRKCPANVTELTGPSVRSSKKVGIFGSIV